MILYSYLGLGKQVNGVYKYDKVKYSYQGKSIETDYFPYAAYKFANPEKVVLILTEESYKEHSLRLKDLFEFEPLIIPIGKNENEIWQIFSSIADNIPERCRITLDITHGFRSQPIIGIASLLYLKATRDIQVNKILYGAYEAKTDNEVPVFDLSPFITLIEWSNAANEFIKHANAKQFAGLLSEIHDSTYKKKLEHKSESLKSIGKILNDLSKGLSIVATQDIFKQSSLLPNKVDGLCNDLNEHIESKPFSLILKRISDVIEPISQASKDIFNKKGIEAQLNIIEWYIATENYQQAITLISELFITLYAIKKEKHPLNERKEASTVLGDLVDKSKNNNSDDSIDIQIGKMYNQISETRNEINHAGMKPQNTRPGILIEKIKKHYKTVKEFYHSIYID